MKLTSKIITLGAAVLFAFSAANASAADWAPKGPLTLQIGFGAGGTTDSMGRVLANVMEKNTGWNIIVENKPGGGGVAMFTGLARKPPQGKVIGMGVSLPVLVQLVKRGDKLPFDLESFDYLGTIAKAEVALVAGKDAPFDDLESMVAYAKKSNDLTVATMASPQVLMMKATTRVTDAKFNLVTADGGAEVMKLILGGQVMAGFGSGEEIPYLKSGAMKVIAGINQTRLTHAPEVKTFIESGVNAYVDPVYFLATKKGTDPEAVKAISAAIDVAVQSPEVAEIVKNITNGLPLNMGVEGTAKMMTDGLENSKVLLSK